VITNERQYRITKAEAERFVAALHQEDEGLAHLHPSIRRAMREGAQSQLDELQDQLKEYEAAGDGPVPALDPLR